MRSMGNQGIEHPRQGVIPLFSLVPPGLQIKKQERMPAPVTLFVGIFQKREKPLGDVRFQLQIFPGDGVDKAQ